MKNLYIIGDSFMDPNVCQDGGPMNQYDYRWFVSLEKIFTDYTYNNLSIIGAGSHHSMGVFLNLIMEEKITKNDIIVMHLSAMMRTLDEYLDNDSSGALKLQYPNTIENNMFFVSYLYMMSQKIKFKLILFAENVIMRDENENYTNEYSFNYFRSLNNEYFHFSKYNLFEVARNELEYEHRKYDYGDVMDKRFNHLSEENHINFFNYIIDVLEGEKILTQFKENFKRPEEIYKNFEVNSSSNLKTKFIYE